MYNKPLHFRVSVFRSRLLVWILLTALLGSFLPAVSLAQQPTATITALNGTVLVNGQEQAAGAVLSPGDVIETQAGATVVLELSDGSSLELGENTNVEIALLSQTAPGARVSQIKLMWGWIRAKLSPGHQQAGSVFDIHTPNAVIGVKFSQPDVEVSYDQAKAETIGVAHTVELMAKNLFTDEELLVPVGSSVIIVGTTIKIVAGILAVAGASEAGAAGAGAAETATTGAGTTSGTAQTGTTAAAETATTGAGTTSATAEAAAAGGMGTGTMVAIGVGAAAAAGGVAAIAANSGESGGTELPFTGIFEIRMFGVDGDCFRNDVEVSCSGQQSIIWDIIQQDATSVTVDSTVEVIFTNCCTANVAVPFTGTVNGTSVIFNTPAFQNSCQGTDCSFINIGVPGNLDCTLIDNDTLRCGRMNLARQ